MEPDHLDAALVLPDRLQHVTGRARDRPAHDHEHDRGVREREPVEVLRVQDADERVRDRLEVQAEALLAARQLVGVLLHEHLAGLRERERDHRERDPAHTQADRAEHERDDDPDHGDHQQRRRQPPLPLRQRDRGQVDAEREVEGVPEREQPREAEEEVVRERDPGEDEAEREQPERARTVERPAEENGDVEREQRHDRERRNQHDRHEDGTDAAQCATFGARPSGLSRSTIASRSTTARSPSPLE
jgi:hypothetical protein